MESRWKQGLKTFEIFLGDPFLLSTHLRKPLYLRLLSMCLFSRTFQKVQPGIIFAVWDVCPQADRRVSSGILYAPRPLHSTAPSQPSQQQEITYDS